jgi:hypothetical protein
VPQMVEIGILGEVPHIRQIWAFGLPYILLYLTFFLERYHRLDRTTVLDARWLKRRGLVQGSAF